MKLQTIPWKLVLIHNITKQKYVFYRSTTLDIEWDERIFTATSQNSKEEKPNDLGQRNQMQILQF